MTDMTDEGRPFKDLFKQTKIAENDQWFVYDDSFTEGVNKRIGEKQGKLPALPGWSVHLYEKKDGTVRAYLLLDDKQNVVADAGGFEGICYQVDMFRAIRRKDK